MDKEDVVLYTHTHTHTHKEYYSAKEEKKVLSFATTRMHLEAITLSEQLKQRKKNILFIIHMQYLKPKTKE